MPVQLRRIKTTVPTITEHVRAAFQDKRSVLTFSEQASAAVQNIHSESFFPQDNSELQDVNACMLEYLLKKWGQYKFKENQRKEAKL
jgi:hypothetical protein